MTETTPCPCAQVLEHFLVGRLSEVEAEDLERHLAACGECRGRLGTLAPRDPLIEAISTAGRRGSPPLEDVDEAVLARLYRLHPHSALAEPSAFEGTEAETPPPPRAGFGTEATDELYNFLEPPTGPDEIGRLRNYRVLGVLGAGGMGVVFLAEDLQLQRRVALKAMRPVLVRSAAARERFLREARALAAVKHDHVVTVYQVDEQHGAAFLAMELLEGETLEERLRREGRLPTAEVLRIGREAAEGLAAAHRRGLIHRDIKPGNLWLEADTGRVKVLDFGLARATGADVPQTSTGVVLGTPAYMAPEQARGEQVDVRCDLFSLGCVLYRLATGEAPFRGKDAMSTLLSLALDSPRSPRALQADVPPALDDLILRLLAKDPAQRPASAEAVAAALRDIERALAARKTKAPIPRRRWRVRAAVAALLTAAALAAVVVIIRDQHGRTIATYKVPPDGSVELRQDARGTAAVKGVPASPPDDAWLKQVAALPAKQQVERVVARLKERNPGFDGEVTSKIQEGAVIELTLVTDHVTDLSPLRALPRLAYLTCNGSAPTVGKGALADLSPLKDLKLELLNCTGTRVSDLSPLKGMPLRLLYCNATLVSDLTPLHGMPLEALHCNDTPVADLSPLRGMNLTHLLCTGTRVSDLSPLRNMKLQRLWCHRARVSDLSPLNGMPLKELRCDFKPGRDTAILRSLTTLEAINDKPAAEFWKDGAKGGESQ